MSNASNAPPELDTLSNEQLRVFRETFNVIDQAGEGFIMRTGRFIDRPSIYKQYFYFIQTSKFFLFR